MGRWVDGTHLRRRSMKPISCGADAYPFESYYCPELRRPCIATGVPICCALGFVEDPKRGGSFITRGLFIVTEARLAHATLSIRQFSCSERQSSEHTP